MLAILPNLTKVGYTPQEQLGDLMRTSYAMLIERCGLSHKEAADFHEVKSDTINDWTAGRAIPPDDEVDRLRDLYHIIQTMAYDAIDMIEVQDPEGVELELAKDDDEAVQLGLPCVGAHRAAIGTVVALCDRQCVIAKQTANDE